MPEPSIIQKALAALKQKVSPAPAKPAPAPGTPAPAPTVSTSPEQAAIDKAEADYRATLANADAHRAQLEGRSYWQLPGVEALQKIEDRRQGTQAEEFAQNHPTIKAAVRFISTPRPTKDYGVEEAADKLGQKVQHGEGEVRPIAAAMSVPGALTGSFLANQEKIRQLEARKRLMDEELKRLSPPIDGGELD